MFRALACKCPFDAVRFFVKTVSFGVQCRLKASDDPDESAAEGVGARDVLQEEATSTAAKYV